jgi:SAM-dependent methyltransferase
MDPGIDETCRLIAGPWGEGLLRLMRSLYFDSRADLTATKDSAFLLKTAAGIGLLIPSANDGMPALTATGYLVGNVAKEYCNWIDHGRLMPAPRPTADLIDGKDVLDLGCSFGRWLWEFQKTARSAVGVERQPEYAALGEALARREGIPAPRIITRSVEDIDFPDASFDTVFCRLVMNHVDLDRTVGRVGRVLRPEGTFWIQVESLGFAVGSMLKERRLRSTLFYGFGIGNTLCIVVTGAQLQMPGTGRMHARHRSVYPSAGWWGSYLVRQGFSDFCLVHRSKGTFAFTAGAAGLKGAVPAL